MKSMKNIVLTVFFTVFLLFSSTVFSQNSNFEEWFSADTEHLPQNSVKSISPDKYGFIWLTTENGLVRFDGDNFKIFNSNNLGIVSNRFVFLSGNIKRDSLKTSTGDNLDQILISKRKATKLKNKNSKEIDLEYYNKRLYLNITNRTNLDLLDSKILDENGNFYLIGKKVISFYDQKKKSKKEIKHNYKATNDYFLIENELVCLDAEGNYSLFKDNFLVSKKISIPSNSKIIYNHLTQQYFVCTDSKFYVLKKANNKIFLSSILEKNKINFNTISCLYYDAKNNKLFIGTHNKGLAIITVNKFNTLTNKNSGNNNYYATIPFSKNEFITAKGEIYSKNGIEKDLKLNHIGNQYSITIDQQKNIWIPYNDKLIRYTKVSNYKSYETYDFKLEVAVVFCDSKNKIWVGFKDNPKKKAVVVTIDPTKEKIVPLFLNNIVEPIHFFSETKEHTLLMVGKRKIIFYKEEKKDLKTIATGINEIRSIFICKDQNIWICTYNNGFSLLKNGKLIKLPYDNKQFLISSHCISEDNKGHFWISTNRGLIEVAKASLLNYIDKKTPVYYHHYDTKNGFLTNEFNGGCQPCNSKLENGYFVYPSLNGLLLFHPEKVSKIVPIGEFFINEAEIENKTIYFNDTLRISRDDNRIKIKIDFPYFGNEDNINFEAKLELNGNSKWINIYNEKRISFTNLPPGNHTLFVRKIGGFSSNYQTKKIVICVPFLFYETIWFKILVTILIIGLIILSIRFRYNYLKRKNYALEQIILDRTKDLKNTINSLKITKNNLRQEIIQQKKLIGTISHDIKSPLKFLSITAKHLHEKSLSSENLEVKDNAKIMHESSQQLYTFVENLVDYSKIFLEHNKLNPEDLEDIDVVIKEKINFFKNIAEANRVVITYQNLSNTTIKLNKKIIGIIIHNLLDNSIKNTTIGNIKIETKIIKNILYLSVEDTGNGMPIEIKKYYINLLKNYETDKLAIQNYGLGLHMVLELLKLLKGDLKIDTQKGKGTKVTIIIDQY